MSKGQHYKKKHDKSKRRSCRRKRNNYSELGKIESMKMYQNKTLSRRKSTQAIKLTTLTMLKILQTENAPTGGKAKRYEIKLTKQTKD